MRRTSVVVAVGAALAAVFFGGPVATAAEGVTTTAGGPPPVPSVVVPAACPDRGEPTAGPLPGGNGPADFGAVPEACSGRDLSLRLRGALLVASSMPDYYGSIAAVATVRLRHPLGLRGWFSVAFDALTYRYINNGGLASSGGSIGPPTVGYHRAVTGTGTERVSAAVYGRALLPVDTARTNGVSGGLELGVAVRARLRPRLTLEGGLAVAAPADFIADRVHARLEPAALAEAHLRLRPWLGLFGGASLRVRGTPSPALLSASPRLGARVASRRGLFGGLLVEAPVAGSDRTDLIAGLHLGFAR